MTTSKSSRRRARLSAANTTAPTAPAATAVAAPAPSVSHEEWRHEYDYVFKDLRKLFVVSGVLFAIIVALGFFI